MLRSTPNHQLSILLHRGLGDLEVRFLTNDVALLSLLIGPLHPPPKAGLCFGLSWSFNGVTAGGRVGGQGDKAHGLRGEEEAGGVQEGHGEKEKR